MTRNRQRLTRRGGIIFILSAPSGAGKTTLIKGLRSIYPDIELSVSWTTRSRRGGEVNGREYRFVTQRQFDAMRAKGQFAEWAKVHNFLYGTPRRPLDSCVKGGRDMLLDIDVQGARKIKRVYRDSTSTFRGLGRSSECIATRWRFFCCRRRCGNWRADWHAGEPKAGKPCAAGSPTRGVKFAGLSSMITTSSTGM